MGAVVDEETGQEPSCIFCDSRDDCPHLVAVIDRTFSACNGGALYDSIGELRELLADRISATLANLQTFGEDGFDYELASIFRGAVENYDPGQPDDVYVDEQMFLAWLIEALLNAGADEPPGYIVEEGGPGQSSALTLLYAPNPSAVISKVARRLHEQLSSLKSREFGPDADEESHTQVAPEPEPIPREEPSSKQDTAQKQVDNTSRPVLIVVTDWPSGTMAFKFGGSLQASLGVTKEEMKLVQMTPERIFRVETKISETDFRKAMNARDVASGGTVLFLEIPKS